MNQIRRARIIIAPAGGLCNRMQALDSAICLSEATGSDLYVFWYQQFLCSARFDDLFVAPDVIKKIVYANSGNILQRSLRFGHDAFLSHLIYDLRVFPEDMSTYAAHRYDFDQLIMDKRAVYVKSYSRFFHSPDPFRTFAPIAPLQKIIESVTQDFDNVVGIHIRRTDNRKSIEHSPTSSFIELMEQEIRADNSTRFFVATDSPEEEEHLRQVFPNRIITYKKRALARDTPVAIQDAVVDLYCLSRCRKLIGSYWSSFSDTAWQINGIEHVIAGNIPRSIANSHFAPNL